MKDIIRKAFVLIIFAQLITGLSVANALASENQYSNQLLKLNLEKSSDSGNINVTVYSSHPYRAKITPVKKNDNEYDIFLPNTYHSITSKQNISSLDSDIQDVDVKLIPNAVSTRSNGYTRIAIKTKGESLKFNVNNKVVEKDKTFNKELMTLIGDNSSNVVVPKKQIYYKHIRQHSYSNIKLAKLPKINSDYHSLNKKIVKSHSKQSFNKETTLIASTKPVSASKTESEVKYVPQLIQTGANTAIIVKKPINSNAFDNNSKAISTNINQSQVKTNYTEQNQSKSHHNSSKKLLWDFFMLMASITAPSLAIIFYMILSKKWQKAFDLTLQEPVCKLEDLSENEAYSEVSIKELAKFTNDEIFNIIYGVEISDSKGIYLVELNGEKALIGLVDENVYVLSKFKNINESGFTIKKADSITKIKDTFYIQLGPWHGLVSSKQNAMNLEMVF